MDANAVGRTARPGVRPLSGRFLRETLGKLSEDACRVALPPVEPPDYVARASPDLSICTGGSRQQSPLWPTSASSPLGGASVSAVERDGDPLAAASMARWRKMLQDETRECARLLQSTLERAEVSQAATEMRKADAEEIASLRNHVDELLRLNRSLRQTSMDHITTDEFTRLKASICDMTQSVNSLLVQQQGDRDANLARVADEAISRALSARDKDGISLRELWNRQDERWGFDDKRWVKLNWHLDRMWCRLGELEDKSGQHAVSICNEAQSTQRQLCDRLELLLREQASEIKAAARKDAWRASEATREAAQDDRESLRRHVASISDDVRAEVQRLCFEVARAAEGIREAKHALRDGGCGTSGEGGDASNRAGDQGAATGWRTVEQALRRLDDQLREWGKASREDMERWRDEAMRWRAELESRAESESWRSAAEHVRDDLRASQAKLDKTETERQRLLGALDAAKLEPVVSTVANVNDVERRGNVRVNMRTGDIEVSKGMEFVPRNFTDLPSAAFRDLSAVEPVMQDIVELQKLFNVPLVVECHIRVTKGGTEAFWQLLMQNRAELVAAHLESRGIEKRLMVPRGLPGKKGLNKACVVVRLEMFERTDSKNKTAAK